MTETEALVIAHRADAKVDAHSVLLRELVTGLSTKLDSIYYNLDNKIDILRKENTEQHREARQDRESQVNIIKDRLSTIVTEQAVTEEKVVAYVDAKDTATNSRITKIIYWIGGLLGAGTASAVGIDKVVPLLS